MNQIREIDTGTPMTRFARGWHCLGLAENFRDGKPHGIQAFGGKLVVYADTKGDIHVLDGYCRHLGADLAKGSIKGDNVACPFHDWRWNGATGRCAEIPTPAGCPSWHAPASGRPWRSTANCWCGTTRGLHAGTGTGARRRSRASAPTSGRSGRGTPLLIEGSHCREIVDNNVDMAHFFYIHYAYPTYFKNVFEGHTASQFMESKGGGTSPSTRSGCGRAPNCARGHLLRPGVHDQLAAQRPGTRLHGQLGADQLPLPDLAELLHAPVRCLRGGAPGMSKEKADKLAESYSKVYEVGFLQDVEIWKHKTRIENPCCAGRGTVRSISTGAGTSSSTSTPPMSRPI